jgi:hypothetical protein
MIARPTPITHIVASVVAAGLVLSGGCAASGPEPNGATSTQASPGPTTVTSPTTTGTRPVQPSAAQAMAAYQRGWDVTFQAISSRPPRVLPEIYELFTGEALSETLNGINRLIRQGHHVEGSMTTHPVLVSESATTVVLDDCAVENSIEYDNAGRVFDPADNVRFNYRVRIVKVQGIWKTADFDRRERVCTPA